MSVDDDSTSVLWERHKSLYFADGNVVLQAPLSGNTRRGLLFRVHQSVLSSHSPVFSDMFIVCNEPSNIDKTKAEADFYDGVPLVHIPDDENHLESILKILYYQGSLPYTPRDPDYPVLVAPILEVSRKYGINRIYDQIKSHLESDWPQTLKDWDRLEKDIESMIKDQAQDAGFINDHFPEPGAAIKVARQFDIPSILPAAFYHLSRLSILDDWDKMPSESKSTQIQNRTRRTARWSLLSAQDLRCYLLAKAEFAEIVREWTDLPGKHKVIKSSGKLYGNGFSSGTTSEDCQLAERLWKGVRDRCLHSADPLALLRNPISGETEDCRTCANGLRDKITVLREKIWEKLGELCNLTFE